MSPADLLASGLIANPDHVMSATASVSGGDAGRPQRALDLRVLGGLDLRLLPDRGLDIAGAWFAGVPLHWTSRIGEAAPLENPRGSGWIETFVGGLLTTCGLRNVGLASEGESQHGSFSHLPARDVQVSRDSRGDQPGITVRAVIVEADALDTHLRCERVVTTSLSTAALTVTDTVTNLGPTDEVAPLLYHVNIGAPMWAPGATIDIDSTAVLPRDAAAAAGLARLANAPTPGPAAPEMVFEHVGATRAVVDNDELGLRMEITWDTATLPRLHQWVHPRAGVYALGVEPSNASIQGRAHDRAEGRLPTLAPGESRTTHFTVVVT